MEEQKKVELLGQFYREIPNAMKADKAIVVQEKEVKVMLADKIKSLKKQATEKLLTKAEKDLAIYEAEKSAYEELVELSQCKANVWQKCFDIYAQLPAEFSDKELDNQAKVKAGLGLALSHKKIAQNKIDNLVKPFGEVDLKSESVKEEDEEEVDELSYDGFKFASKQDMSIYLDCIKAYNDKYILMDLEGQSVVSEIFMKNGLVTYKHRKFKMFLEATCDDIFYTKDKFGGKKKNYFNQIWLETKSMRKRYTHSTFEPNPTFNDDDTYNFWKGFVEPKKGSVAKFYNHVSKLVVGTAEQKLHLIKQFAYSVRFPHDNFGVVPAFRGKPGCGKTTLSETFMAICPNHTVMTSNLEKLLDGFNGETVYIKYFLGEEALWGGDKRLEGKFKHAVTGKQREIEIKGVTKFYIPNYSQFILTSNEKWIMPAGEGDRRAEIFDCTDEFIGNHAYFAEYHDWLYGEGKNALMYHFLYEIDLEGFNPRQLVETKAKLDVKLASMGHVQQFLYNALSGDIADGGFDKWADVEYQPKRQDLYDIFKYCTHSKVTLREFSQTMAEVFKFPTNWKDNWKSSSRGSYYKLGTLKDAREAFCNHIKAKYEDVFGSDENTVVAPIVNIETAKPKQDSNNIIQLPNGKYVRTGLYKADVDEIMPKVKTEQVVIKNNLEPFKLNK